MVTSSEITSTTSPKTSPRWPSSPATASRATFAECGSAGSSSAMSGSTSIHPARPGAYRRRLLTPIADAWWRAASRQTSSPGGRRVVGERRRRCSTTPRAVAPGTSGDQRAQPLLAEALAVRVARVEDPVRVEQHAVRPRCSGTVARADVELVVEARAAGPAPAGSSARPDPSRERRVMAGQRPGERRVRRPVDDAGRRHVVHRGAGAVDQRRVGEPQQPRGVVLERGEGHERRAHEHRSLRRRHALADHVADHQHRAPARPLDGQVEVPAHAVLHRARSARRGRAPAAATIAAGRSASRVASSSSSSRVIVTWRSNSTRHEHARDREPERPHERRDQRPCATRPRPTGRARSAT